MQVTKEVILAKIKELRAERAKTRILRARQIYEERIDNQESLHQLDSYLSTSEPPRPIFISPITPTMYLNPPKTPEVRRNPNSLKALSILFPIGKHPIHFGQWYIVSPEFYIDEACDFKQEWNENMQRIFAVLNYAATLLTLISKATKRDLPYNITIEKNQIMISNFNANYDLLSMSHQREFFIALKLLNGDANFFGNNGQNALLPNLQAALKAAHQSIGPTIQHSSKSLI